jgi:hypothetical protein
LTLDEGVETQNRYGIDIVCSNKNSLAVCHDYRDISRFLATNMFETYYQIFKTLHFIVKTMTSQVSIFE